MSLFMIAVLAVSALLTVLACAYVYYDRYGRLQHLWYRQTKNAAAIVETPSGPCAIFVSVHGQEGPWTTFDLSLLVKEWKQGRLHLRTVALQQSGAQIEDGQIRYKNWMTLQYMCPTDLRWILNTPEFMQSVLAHLEHDSAHEALQSAS